MINDVSTSHSAAVSGWAAAQSVMLVSETSMTDCQLFIKAQLSLMNSSDFTFPPSG